MQDPDAKAKKTESKPICVALTCWRWQSGRVKAISETAKRLGVTLQLRQKTHGLHREIQAEVSGRNVDQFIGEFARNC